MSMRAKLREKYNLAEDSSDFVAACFLSPLAVCQETREIEYREKFGDGTVRTMQPLRMTDSADQSEMSLNNDTSQTS
jgi:hypothetical protein